MKAHLAAFAAVVLLAIPGHIMAADLSLSPAYKAPLAAPAPTWSWTGFYVGGEVGAKWTQSTWTATSLEDVGTAVLPKTLDASASRGFDPAGIRAGGYLGYNWSFATQWIGGIEADFGYANAPVASAGLPGCSIMCVTGFPGPGVDSAAVAMRWDASVRARLGYLITPDVLLYGTGGIAWQDFETSGTCQHSFEDPFCLALPGDAFSTIQDRVVRTGWTVGGGLETHIFRNWLLRTEYRYSYFGTWSDVFNFTGPGEPPGFETYRYQLRTSTQIATVGLAYKFDWGAPIIARY